MRTILSLGLVFALGAASAQAAPCGGDFGSWLNAFRSDAAAAGIPQRTIASALSGLAPDPRVIALDRRQGVFKQSFEQFGLPRIAARIGKARRLAAQHAGLLRHVEQRFGVPGSIVVAIWGLETDFGVNMGHQPAIRSLATLAHDCRRSEKFQGELLDALRIVARGDLSVHEMRGAWAGELGQTQFLPSSYVRFAVDFDGDGRRNLIRSVPDVLASTANYLRGYGWRRGASCAEGGANFAVLREWNRSAVYARTICAFGARIAGE